MGIEDYNRYGRIRFRDETYVLVGMKDSNGYELGVRIGEKCDSAGFYPAKWLAVDSSNPSVAVAVVTELGHSERFNPETESILGEQA